MKKIWKVIAGALAFAMLAPVAACKSDPAAGKTVVKVAYYAAGFGTTWMEHLKTRYEAEHPDIYLKLEGDPGIEDKVKQRLDTGKAELADDLCVFGGSNYRYMIRNDQLMDLTSLYEEEVEPGITLDSIVNQQMKDYYTVDGKIYAVPWQNNSMNFVYNANMFDQYGWEIPETMDEFFLLCEQIRNDTNNAVNPVAYCGAANQGYFPGIMESWVAQYEGIDAMMEFLACETAEVYQQQEAARTKAYQTAAKIMLGTDSKGRRYCDPDSRGYYHLDAQAEMLAGRSAMVISGPWMQIEMSEYLVDYPNFRMGIMPVPHINADKLDKNGEDSANVRTSAGGAGVVVIPKNAQHADIALDFLKFSLTQESLADFVEDCDGLTRPYTLKDTSLCHLEDDYFAQTTFEMFSTQPERMIYTCSTSEIWLAGEASMWMANNGGPITALASLTYEQAMSEAAELAKEDYEVVKEKWDTWKVT